MNVKVGQTLTTKSSKVTGTVAEVVPFDTKDGRHIVRVRLVTATGTSKWTTL